VEDDMMNSTRTVAMVSAAMALVLAFGIVGRAAGTGAGSTSSPGSAEQVERGAYLVRTMVCNDCHTPWKMGASGPEPDMSRMLSGHPQDLKISAPAEFPKSPWGWMGAESMTAFAGPWGVSFTANLTPDKETGLGMWTAETFIATLRTGRHLGKGRHILPPMPWKMIGTATDDDLRAIFAYLQSIPPVRNRVPAPLDPPATGESR
jgi:mono/diheme cytochrome c family protein